MGKRTVAFLAFLVGLLCGVFYPWPKPELPCYFVSIYDKGKFFTSIVVREQDLGHSMSGDLSADIELCHPERKAYLEQVKP